MTACRFIATDQPRACGVEDCGKPHYSTGLCVKHFRRFQRYGDVNGCAPSKSDGPPMLLGEEWLPVVDYVGEYEVSNLGRVRSVKSATPRLLKGALNAQGYPAVYLWTQGSGTYRLVHRLMALAFLGPQPPGHEVRHLDGNKLNASIGNLAFGTRSENTQDQVRHGTHVWLMENRPTSCKSGHEFTPENTRWRKDTKVRRVCRTCAAARARAARARKKAAA